MKRLLLWLGILMFLVNCRKDFSVGKTEVFKDNFAFKTDDNGIFATNAIPALLKKKAREVSQDNPVIFQHLQKSITVEPGVILVASTNEASVEKLGRVVRKIFNPIMGRAGKSPIYKLQVKDVEKSLKEAKGMGMKAERNGANHALDYTTEPDYSNGTLYGMKLIHADSAWAAGNLGDQNVYIGISDQGIYRGHTQLKDNIFWNPGEIEGDNIDNDGNGYVDDVNGWNFIDRTGYVYMGNDFHATHVDGTATARMDGVTVAGVCPNATSVSIKFLDGQGGYGFDDDAIESFYYIDALMKKYFPDKHLVINCSWGGSPFSQFMLDAINALDADGIGLCCAAGNSHANNDDPSQQMFPAAYVQYGAKNIIAVGAVDANSNPAPFSNFGKTTVDLYAPGVGIKSTISASAGGGDGYLTISGTSMATPHVTGAVAAYWAANPTKTFKEIKAYLVATVTKVPALTDLCISGGILNLNSPDFKKPTAGHTIDRPFIQPYVDTVKPIGPKITSIYSGPLDSTWTVNWTRGYDPGHETEANAGVLSTWVFLFDSTEGPNDRYAIIFYPYPTGTVTVGTSASPFSDPQKVYGCYLQHPDKFGNWSDITEYGYARPQGNGNPPPPPDTQAPSDPSGLAVSGQTQISFTLGWNASTDNVGVTGYNVSINGVGSVVTGTSKTFTGLTAGTTYTLGVSAFDAAGNVSNIATTSGTTLPNNPPPPPDTTINSFSGANKVLSWNVTPAGTVEIQRSNKQNTGFQTIATSSSTSYTITMKPQKWYRIKYGSKVWLTPILQ